MSCLIREVKTVSKLTYPDTRDEYGQKRTGTPESTSVKMVIKNYSNTNVTDPRYVQVTDVGLTYDDTITTANQIKDGDTVYNVLFTIPTQKFAQVFLRKI